jgi:GNAT superfamily N-acetyltransferase
MTPGIADLVPVIAATWPAEATHACGPFTVAQSNGGGSRVRAARLQDPHDDGSTVQDAQIKQAAAAMAALGQPDLFMVPGTQTALDTRLAALGYARKDPTLALIADCAALAAPPPPVTCFEVWPPLAAQDEIWVRGGIGPDRLAIMQRVTGPRISLFGRINNHPAATAFVALQGDIAMLHALEVVDVARRQGLAGHVMRAAGQWALGQGARHFSVLVTRENLPAQGLYTSLGFQPVGHYHYRVNTG